MSKKATKARNKPECTDWQELVEHNLPLVKYVLSKLTKNLPPSVDRDDLLGAGSVGLIEAARKFEPARNVPFHSYAIPRIWGAMLDELRARDRLSTEMRDQVNRLGKVREELRREGTASPTLDELAAAMKCSVEKVSKLMRLARVGRQYASVDGTERVTADKALYARRSASAPRGPYECVEFGDACESLARAIGHLPEREKRVVLLRYHEGLYLHEIGKILHVSESRVCQLHGQALRRLKRTLKGAGLGSLA
jgi:RNA polymerase sigma factor for flagellar operon FliA